LVVDKQLNLYIVPRRRSLPVCSVCGRKRPMCDKLRPRSWRHVKLWGIETFIIYSPRRVNCPVCGIKVEKIPWSMGKSSLSMPLIDTLQRMAKYLSFNDVVRWATHSRIKQMRDFAWSMRKHQDGIL